MKTGEGKTLVATLPVYLNALAGKGVHVVTVNDYLASRDAEWMGQIYKFLGLTVGVIVHGLDDDERRAAYACDITYGTNNEFGFDYLRDNMKYELAHDGPARASSSPSSTRSTSILIDEARTPLIISGPLEDRSELYITIDTLHPEARQGRLRARREAAHRHLHRGRQREDRAAAARSRPAQGRRRSTTSRTSPSSTTSTRRCAPTSSSSATRTTSSSNGEVIIIDEFTGRMMPGRRYSEGLHQALEAKEHVQIQPENQTLASITFQNYFRLYEKLAGMTGTAATEADEFIDIYGSTSSRSRPTADGPRRRGRRGLPDGATRSTRRSSSSSRTATKRGQPVLVGTTSIEKSEILAELLRKRGWQQRDFSDPAALATLFSEDGNDKVLTILNARYHEQEA